MDEEEKKVSLFSESDYATTDWRVQVFSFARSLRLCLSHTLFFVTHLRLAMDEQVFESFFFCCL